MPGQRISSLTAIAGASTANDDNLVIFDTDANTTKRILRSQLAIGIVGDLPYGANVTTFLTTPSSANLRAAVTDETGTGTLVFANTPTLVTPVLGVATATSINKVALTAPATGSTLTIANGKTLTANNSLTLAGTDGTTQTFPASSTTIAGLGVAQTFTAQQTLSSGLVLQTVAAVDIAAIANAINTTGKVAGKVVYDTTNNRLMVANGSAAADPWYVADGSASVTPA